jgi:DNA-binding CsgD family transcriptional regulator
VSQAALYGREREIRALEDRFNGVHDRGGALLIRGEAGVGKSSLLGAAKSLAQARGMAVLAAAGVRSEANLPFTGLLELLRPILGGLDRLAGPQQNALRAAFGLAEVPAADLFLIALGALDLLADFASNRPLLSVVDDFQWLDRSSANAFVFIARRLQSEPIVLLLTSREIPELLLDDVVPELHLRGLDQDAATALLQARYPDLPFATRDRILHESAGNPLALVELPKAITSERSRGGLLPPHLPLTARLERAFASRISDLPLPSRQLLLTAALSDRPSLAEVMSAAKVLRGADLSLEALAPPVDAGLLTVNTVNLYFRHPLVRSAIHQASSIAERVAAHGALAAVLKDDADRYVWHRAAATVGVDDAVAQDLEYAAARAQQRGDVRVAIRGLERAAQLSSDAARRARCLLQAAELAFEIGWPEIVVDLLQKAEALELTPRDRIRLTWFREATIRTVSGGEALTVIADNIKTDDDVHLALDLLSGPATRGWWAEPDEQVCEHVISAVERVRGTSEDDPRFLLILAMTAPIHRGAFVIERLHSSHFNFDGDARTALLLGLIASQVGDFTIAERFLNVAVAGLRAQGRLPLLAHALVLRAWSALYQAKRNVAIADAAEGERLALETDRPIYAAIARGCAATLAAFGGDHEASEALAAQAENITQPLGILMAEVQIARGMNALATGRYDDSWRHFHRMFDPADSAYHPMRHCYYVGDLAEAAILCGRRDAAKKILSEMEELARRTPAPQFHSAMHCARAALADDEDAEPLFETALAADSIRSPFTKARLRLAYGSWLRRARKSKEARAELLASMETFDSLGASPWSERARQELRAAGVRAERRTRARRESLTPQELQIAMMAAEGLSNREIGQRLYLSHRTIGSHLHRLFPKLGITSRAQLHATLASEAGKLG